MSSTGRPPSSPGRENSRDSLGGAGWGAIAEDLSALLPPALQGKPPFSWLRLKSLTGGRRNDPLAKLLGDPSHERRQAWLNQMYGDGRPDLTIDRTDLDAPSFLLLGDTGEGDISQYAPMSIIESVAAGTDFMVICSDVIYPAGGTWSTPISTAGPTATTRGRSTRCRATTTGMTACGASWPTSAARPPRRPASAGPCSAALACSTGFGSTRTSRTIPRSGSSWRRCGRSRHNRPGSPAPTTGSVPARSTSSPSTPESMERSTPPRETGCGRSAAAPNRRCC